MIAKKTPISKEVLKKSLEIQKKLEKSLAEAKKIYSSRSLTKEKTRENFRLISKPKDQDFTMNLRIKNEHYEKSIKRIKLI
jgi:chromosome segregation and condensation protein ScpB